jgi:hypothetical protein
MSYSVRTSSSRTVDRTREEMNEHPNPPKSSEDLAEGPDPTLPELGAPRPNAREDVAERPKPKPRPLASKVCRPGAVRRTKPRPGRIKIRSVRTPSGEEKKTSGGELLTSSLLAA